MKPEQATALKMAHFKLGDQVEKRSGYKWPGVVVSAFLTMDAQVRYVVECTEPAVKGALHIYNASQLRMKQ